MAKIILNKWFNPYLPLILGLFFFLSIPPDNSPAAEIHVPAQFPTIQAAIDASTDNDIIVVDPGLYTENVDFNGKGITVRSTNPPDSTVVAATVIDGNMNGSVVTFRSGETQDSVLSGFTIRNGSGTLLDGKRYGGGIYCGNQATPTIRFNRIINNSADIGGGLYIHGNSSPTITDGPKADYPYVGIGQMRHLSVTATDPDNEPLIYRWVSREGGTITGTGSAVTFSANTAGVYPIDLTVDDQHGGLATGTVTVTVIGVTIQTASMTQLSTGNPVTLKAAVTPTIANSAQYPGSITWSLTEGPATGSFDAAVNGTPQATAITFTPSSSGPGRLQAVYRVGTATSSNSITIALNPIAADISPTSGFQETTVQAVISGNNLSRVNGLSLGGSGVSGTIQTGKTENRLPVQLVIAKEAAPGNRPIILTTPEGQFNTLLIFQIKALPAITADPTSLNLTVGDTGGLTFSIPNPAPTGGLTLTLSSSAPIVATVPPSIIIPEGQQSVQVNVIAVGSGSTMITANAPSYSKAQVPVTVINPPLITFSPSPLNLAKGLVETCTVNVSNPAPAGGLLVTLSGTSGNIDLPSTVTIAESQTSATFIAKGLAVGTVTLAAQAAGYPGANWPVTVTTAQFNLFPGYLPIAVGRSSTLILSLPNKTPAGGLTVNLSSSNTALVTTPAAVTIPEGQKSTSVQVNGVGVGSAVITSALIGFQSAQSTVNVLQVYNISFVPNALFLTPGTSQSADVVISSPAPVGGLTITFNNPSPDKITAPVSVFIAEGLFKTTITISALDTTTVPITVTASSPGLTDGTLTVTLQPKIPTWIKANVTVGAGCRTSGGVGLTGTTAPTGGYTVNLTSSDPSIASVPATVTIPAGSGNSGFTIVGVSPGTAQITISAGGFSATSTVTVVKPTFNLSSWPTQMTLGASTSTAYIYTNVPGGTYWSYYYDNYQSNATNQAVNQALTVSLSSSNGAVLQVPGTVIIAAGNYYVTGFAIQAVGTGSSTITASAPIWNSVTSGAINVVGPWIKASVTVGAGCRTTGGVGLTGTTAPTGGYTVNLSSSDPSIASVPATVTIPAGSGNTGFTIVGVSPGTAEITLSAAGFTATSTVTVVRSTFAFFNLSSQMTQGADTVNAWVRTSVPGGTSWNSYYNDYRDNSSAQVADQAVTVSLSSSNPAVLQVPATVIITAGNYYVTNFAIQAVGTGSSTITASAPNWDSAISAAISVVGPWIKAGVTVGVGCRTTGGVGLTGTTAPAGGYTVKLSSSDPSIASVPASVTIPVAEGSTGFTIVGVSPGTAEITLSAAGYTATSTVTVVRSTFAFFNLPSQMTQGADTVNAWVRTSVPGGTSWNSYYNDYRDNSTSQVADQAVTVSLSSSNPAVLQVPATVIITAGNYYVTNFAIQAVGTGSSTITAGAPNWNSVTSPAISVVGPWIKASVTVGTGCRTTGGVGLTGNTAPAGGYTVNLSSSDPSIASVPASVTIPVAEGSTGFTIVGVSPGTAEITLSAAGYTATSTVTVVRSTFAFFNLPSQMTQGADTVNAWVRTSVPGGTSWNYYYNDYRDNSSAQVADQAVTVSLSSSNPAVLQVPATVTIAAGNYYVTGFAIQAVGTGSSAIMASAPNWDSAISVAISVVGPWIKAGVTVGTGCRTTGGVGLTGTTAPAGGYTVNLSSSDPSIASVPATVTIPAGSGNTGFTIVGVSPGTAQITISSGGFSATSTVTVVKPTFNLSSWPTHMTLGASTSTAYIYTNVPGGTYWSYYYDNYQSNATNQAVNQALTVTLSSSNPAVLQVPATVTIAAGNYYVTNFAIQAVGTGSSTITASAPNWDSMTSSAIFVP